MSVAKLLLELKAKQIELRLDGEDLEIASYGEGLTESLVEQLRENKAGLVELLKEAQRQKDYAAIPKASSQKSYKMSPGQRRLYVLQQMDKDGTAYNMPIQLTLSESLDLEKVSQAFELLIARYESLRTVFRMEDLEPRQIILDNVPFSMNHVVSVLSELDGVFKSFIAPFDLEAGPLFRVSYVSVEDGSDLLLIDMHHIITDGVSQQLLEQEFWQLYNGLELSDVAYQYRDYSEWFWSEAQQEQIASQKSYWLDRFSGELPLLNLPYDYRRPSVKNYQGSRVDFVLSAADLQGLRGLCEQQEATLYMGLLSVFSTWLWKLSGQDDIVVGSPIAGRRHSDLDGIMGMFVNTLAIRTAVDGNTRFSSLLSSIKEDTLSAYAHQEYGFEELVESLKLSRDTSRNPLFDVMLILQNQSTVKTDRPYEVSEISHSEGQSKFDLSLMAEEREDHLYVSLSYSTQLFRAESIERFVGYFRKILTSLSSDPVLSTISILSAEETHHQLKIVNATDHPVPEGTVVDLLNKRVSEHPGDRALLVGSRSYTYEQLDAGSNGVANYLHSNGIGSGDRVGVLLKRDERLIMSLLGVLKSGASYVPIDPSYPQDRIDYLISDSACSCIIDSSLWESGAFEDTNAVSHTIDSDQLAYIIYTSGSTGLPKGVMITHGNLRSFLHWCFEEFREEHFEMVYGVTSVCFDLSIFEIFYSLCSGTPVRLLESALEIEERLSGDRNVLINTVPSVLGGLLKGGVSLSKVSVLNLAGEPIPQSYIDQLDCSRISVRNLYGPSEDTTYSTCYKLDGETEILIGRPISNTQAYVLDSWNNLVPMGSVGELCLSGLGLSKGYLHRESLTAEKFVEHPFKAGERLYRTGDLVQWTASGDLRYLGRKDDQVKLRGYRIELSEIEHCIRKSDHVTESCVVIHEYGANDKALVGFVQVTEGYDEGELLKELKNKLPHYMVPDYLLQVDTIPVNNNGKTDKKQLLRSLDNNLFNESEAFVVPVGPDAEKIVKIWEDLLEKQPVGMKDDFFRSGGHSLKITALSSLIYREWGVVIPFQKFFTHTTPEEQLALIESEQVSGFKKIEKAPQQAFYPLSAAQKRLYFMQELAPESTAYNMPTANYLGKEVDLERMESVINQLIERHEILRTSFVKVNNEPFQKINDHINFKLDKHVCRYEELSDYLDTYLHAFDLSAPSLLRSSIVELENYGYVWIIDMHHIVADGTSLQNMTSEFMLLYNGKEPEQLPIQYRDFSTWQNEQIESGALEEQKKWWMELYSELPPRIELPTDYKRPANFTFEGDYIRFQLNPSTSEQLKSIATSRKGTLQMVLLATLNAMLHKYTGQTDMVVGCGIAGRQHPDLKNLVGMFVNTLAIRNYPKSEMSWEDLFAQVKENSILAYKNQDLQFEELVDMLNIERETFRNPLLDVCLVVQNFDKSKEDISQFIVQNTKDEMDQQSLMQLRSASTAKFDMTWFVEEREGGIDIQLEYYTRIFSRETAERLSHHFLRILDQVIKNPQIKLEELRLLDDAEEQQILKNFVSGKRVELDWDSSIPALFSQQAKLHPSQIAVTDSKGSITYAELEASSNRLARFLKSEVGVLPEQIVGVLQKRDRDSIIAILGVIKAGGAFLLLESSLPEDRLVFMVSEASIDVVLTSKDLVGLASRLQWRGAGVTHLICTNSDDVYSEHGGIKNELTSKDLWEYVGNSATDLITAGGWLSSYDGQAISEKEMEEYSNNAYQKVKSVITPQSRVLEVGCSSGLTMFQIAPNVAEYVGTDLSSSILEITASEVAKRGAENIRLECMPAHEIDRLKGPFDLVVINSVIQCFEDHNYLRSIISKAINLLNGKGHIFIGDVMDEDQREEMIDTLVNHAKSGSLGQTKIDFSSELFVSKDYFLDLQGDGLGVTDVRVSDKIFTIHNELTDFRYDALLTVNTDQPIVIYEKKKFQLDASSISQFADDPIEEIDIRGAHLCYSFFTSGSTGNPKGVMIEHASLHNLCHWYQNYFNLNHSCNSSQYASMSFDAFVFEVFPPLLSGATLTFIPDEVRLEIADLVQFIHEKEVTHCFLPTPIYEEIDALQLLEPLNGKTIVVAGDQLKEVSPSSIRLFNSYGPTENTVATTVMELSSESKSLPPIGTPIDNIHVFILNERNEIQPVGVVGEICTSGKGLARGYINSDALNKEKFIPNPYVPGDRLYRTGDLGKWDSDGRIHFSGRKDDQVKIRGNRIELGEIENCLLSLNEVSAATAVVKVSAFGEKELAVYFVASEQIDKIDIQNFIRKLLPEYMVPSYLYQLDRLPLTKNGKIDKKKLLQMANNEDRRKEDFVQVETETERILVTLWSEILGVSENEISANDNFFHIGGHSLKATRLSSQIHKSFSVKVDLKELFRAPVLSDQAKMIEAASKTNFTAIERIKEQESYVLSSSQQRLWVLSQMTAANSAYNMSQCQIFKGALDIDALNQAFQELICRHESLRTQFKAGETGKVRQYIVPAEDISFSLRIEDVRNRDKKEEYVEAQVLSEAETAFDLEVAPLIRGRLFQTDEQEFVCCYTLHHIISDGWSMEVLFKELLSSYQATKQGQTLELKPLDIQYKDYANWQQEQLNEDSIVGHKTYWIDTFKGEIPVLSLPTKNRRPVLQTYDGERVETTINPLVLSSLKETGNNQGASLFMTLLAGLNVLLYKYSGDTDMIVGTPIAGRNHSDLENQIGFYVNTLPLRVSFTPGTSFSELLEKAVKASYEAFEHQIYPFDDLVNDLALKRDLSRNPLFDVVLAVQSEASDVYLRDAQNKTGLVIEDYYRATKVVSKFDLTFNASESVDGLKISIDFNTNLFERSWITSMLAHFEQILTVVSRSAAVTLDHIRLLSDNEKADLLRLGSGTIVPKSDQNSVLDAFMKCVETVPDRPAVVNNNSSLTYAKLNEKSDQFAVYLKNEHGISFGDVVGLKLHRSEWLVVAQLGAFKLGAAYVPIDPGYPSERVEYMLKSSGSKLLIDEEKVLDFQQKAHQTTLDIVYPSPLDVAYIVYTSGSTGRPKGVVVEHGSLLNLCNWHNRSFGVTENDRATMYAGVGFDASVWEVFPYLCKGATLFVVPDEVRLDTYETNQFFEQQRITVAFLPTKFAEVFFKEKNSSLRYLLVGGDRLSTISETPYVVVNNYGPSEATVVATSQTLKAPDELTIGKPIDNTEIYILSENGDLAPFGVNGEICIGGSGLAKGYLHEADLAYNGFIPNPFRDGERMYRTGDLGRWTTGGNIHFTGRKDDQVSIRGYRIELGEIEHVLKELEFIQEAVVLAHSGELVAFYISNSLVSEAAIKSELKKHLPQFMIPDTYYEKSVFPVTSNGKIDRKELVEGLAGERNRKQEFVPPVSGLEKKLAEIWTKVLEVDQVGLNDDFFAIGGNSIKVTMLIAELRNQFKVKLAFTDVFASSVLKEQAHLIEKCAHVAQDEMFAIDKQECYALSDAQKRLWVLDQFESNKLSYNIPAVVWLKSGTDINVLKVALNDAIVRHEILRTVFKEKDGEVWQYVIEPDQFDFSIDTLDLKSEKDPESAVMNFVLEATKEPFDLSVGPLIRATLLQVGENEFAFYYCLHHIISDGWSMNILSKDVIDFYNFRLGQTTTIPAPLEIQYKDYAAWEKKQHGTAAIENEKQYWLKRLSPALPVLNLPIASERPAVRTMNGNTLFSKLSPAQTEKFERLCKELKGSPFIGLLAVWNVLLHKYTYDTDFIIGTPVSGRERSELQDQIGFYINTLALRNQLNPETSFKAFFERVAANTLNDFSHQNYAFDRVLEHLNVKRDTSRNPVFDVMITLDNKIGASDLFEAKSKDIRKMKENNVALSRFDLDIGFQFEEDFLAFDMNYNVNIYDEQHIQELIRNFHVVLDAILSNPDCTISDLSLIENMDTINLIQASYWSRKRTKIGGLVWNKVQTEGTGRGTVSFEIDLQQSSSLAALQGQLQCSKLACYAALIRTLMFKWQGTTNYIQACYQNVEGTSLPLLAEHELQPEESAVVTLKNEMRALQIGAKHQRYTPSLLNSDLVDLGIVYLTDRDAFRAETLPSMMFEFREIETSVQGVFHYDTGKLDDTDAQMLCERLKVIIEQVILDPETPLIQLNSNLQLTTNVYSLDLEDDFN